MYLYTKFAIPNGEFIQIMLPPFLLAVALITVCCMIFVKPEPLELKDEKVVMPAGRTVIYLLLFALAIAIVFRGIPYWIGLIIIPAFLLVMDRKTGQVKHQHFYDIIDHLNPGDCLVMNDSRVLPARLLGHRPTGGAVEVLLLRQLEAAELITRTGATIDKRRRIIALAAAGEEKLQAVKTAWLNLDRAGWASFAPYERGRILSLLEHYYANLAES